jgi:hypothetical protein
VSTTGAAQPDSQLTEGTRQERAVDRRDVEHQNATGERPYEARVPRDGVGQQRYAFEIDGANAVHANRGFVQLTRRPDQARNRASKLHAPRVDRDRAKRDDLVAARIQAGQLQVDRAPGPLLPGDTPARKLRARIRRRFGTEGGTARRNRRQPHDTPTLSWAESCFWIEAMARNASLRWLRVSRLSTAGST